MSKKKREVSAKLAYLSAKVDTWLKGYQKASLLLMAVGVISFLSAILKAAGFQANSFGWLGVSYLLYESIAPSLEEAWLTVISLCFNFLLMGAFGFCSIFAAKGNAWAMYLGIGLYTADTIFLLIWGVSNGFLDYLPMFLFHVVLLSGFGIMVFYYYKADYYWREYQKVEKASQAR